MVSWPRSKKFASRYFVPDLIPEKTSPSQFRAIFIGESPHRDEVAPESREERSPFRGMAGREWWGEVAKFLKAPVPMRPVPPREVLLKVCRELRIGVMNAVQYPLDAKIALHYGESIRPKDQLGFEKGSGLAGYKSVLKRGGRTNPVEIAIARLAARLEALEPTNARAGTRLICLGNDSKWFTERALERLGESSFFRQKELVILPHPSSWWRNKNYRTKAVNYLMQLFA